MVVYCADNPIFFFLRERRPLGQTVPLQVNLSFTKPVYIFNYDQYLPVAN